MLVGEPTYPGSRIDVRPIGIIQVHGQAAVELEVRCVPLHDPKWRDARELEHVSARTRDEIARFFATDKEPEPERLTAIEGWAGREVAEWEIEGVRAGLAKGERPVSRLGAHRPPPRRLQRDRRGLRRERSGPPSLL